MEIKDINPLWMNEGIDIKINISIWDYPFLSFGMFQLNLR